MGAAPQLSGADLAYAQKVVAKDWWARTSLAAQNDVNVFMPLVFRNDQPTDPTKPLEPFEQQWFHCEWQEAWSTQRVTVIHGATGFGKTDQVIGHLLWRMGRQPSIRILILGKQQENAKRLLAKIKRQIDDNPIVRSIFPSLAPGEIWNSEKLRLAAAGIDTTTNTIECFGIDGSPQGARADIILADDIIDHGNTLTELEREKVIAFVDSVVQSRLTTNGQLHILANAWHPKDLAFTYKEREGIWYGCYPALDPATGDELWPSFRPKAWLESKRGTMSDAKFAAMFLCDPRDEKTKIFKKAWFDAAKALGGRLGIVPLQRVTAAARGGIFDPYAGRMPTMAALAQSSFLAIVVGVDLATKRTQKRRKTDQTSFFTLGLRRDGKRQTLWVESGSWSLDEKIDHFRDVNARYHPDLFLVEDNGVQADIVGHTQELSDFDARVEGFSTTAEKWDPDDGIEEIGVEMRGGLWAIPGPPPGMQERDYRATLGAEQAHALDCLRTWEAHTLDFSRVGHTPDDLMASYFAKEAVKRLANPMFQHSHAHEMAVPPPETAIRAVAGMGAVMAGAFPPPSHEPPEEALRAFGFR